MVTIRNLTLSLGTANVFNDISLKIDDNEILGITGGPGCGKSTLLKVLCNKEKHAVGEVLLGKDNIRDISTSDLRRRVCLYSSREKDINYESTVFNTIIRAKRSGKSIFYPYTADDRESTEKCIEQFELTGYPDTRLKQLHCSARNATLLAAAMNSKCDLLLLDSPECHLAFRQINILARQLKKFTASACRSAVIASSDINFLAKTCDRIVVVHRGRIAETGSHEMIDEDFLKKYYGIEAVVTRNIVTGLPEIHVIDNS